MWPRLFYRRKGAISGDRVAMPPRRCFRALTGYAVVALLSATSLGLPVSGSAATLDENVELCARCHGEAGLPPEKTTPVIWGQMEGYLYLQLRDYKRGTRANEIMAAVVENMDRSDLLALAGFFSKKPWPNLQQPSSPADVALKARQANSSVGCTGCHLDAYQGDSSVPRLAGQSREYMAKTIADFRSHQRGNNPGMSSLMNATSEADLAALTQYLAGL
jgi:cytochrome c553